MLSRHRHLLGPQRGCSSRVPTRQTRLQFRLRRRLLSLLQRPTARSLTTRTSSSSSCSTSFSSPGTLLVCLRCGGRPVTTLLRLVFSSWCAASPLLSRPLRSRREEWSASLAASRRRPCTSGAAWAVEPICVHMHGRHNDFMFHHTVDCIFCKASRGSLYEHIVYSNTFQHIDEPLNHWFDGWLVGWLVG